MSYIVIDGGKSWLSGYFGLCVKSNILLEQLPPKSLFVLIQSST